MFSLYSWLILHSKWYHAVMSGFLAIVVVLIVLSPRNYDSIEADDDDDDDAAAAASIGGPARQMDGSPAYL